MKQSMLIIILILTLLVSGCTKPTNNNPENSLQDNSTKFSYDEMKRIHLYVNVMKAAFNEGNGGNDFIAVNMNTLVNLSDEGKQEVLKRLVTLSDNIYAFDDVKNDVNKFEIDESGNLTHAKNGTVLSINVHEYDNNCAKITATSWYSNNAAYFPTYKATYKNEKWKLELINIAVS